MRKQLIILAPPGVRPAAEGIGKARKARLVPVIDAGHERHRELYAGGELQKLLCPRRAFLARAPERLLLPRHRAVLALPAR